MMRSRQDDILNEKRDAPRLLFSSKNLRAPLISKIENLVLNQVEILFHRLIHSQL